MALNFQTIAMKEAQALGIPPQLFSALIKQESGWNPSARSPVGAMGLTQLMPGTARGLGVNPADPVQNIRGGARYLSQQYKKFGRWDLALAAYNAGPGAVGKYGGIPPYRETQNYVKRILANAGNLAMVPRTPSQEAAPVTNGAVALGGGVAGATPDFSGINPAKLRASLEQFAGKPILAGEEAPESPIADTNRLIRYIASQQVPQTSTSARVVVPDQRSLSPQNRAVPQRTGGDDLSYLRGQGYSWAEALGKKFGLRLSSTYRSPAENRRVGGSPTSAHMTHGKAVDFSGTPAQMRALAQWAIQMAKRGYFKEVFYDPIGQWDSGRFSNRGIGGHSDHVHITR